MSRLALFLFGSPRIELDNTPVKIDRHKAIALLAYLTITAETRSRNTLATLFWPNYDQSRARAALRRALATLNKAGLHPWLEADRETIGLKQTPDLRVDVVNFRRLLATCLAAEEASDSICLPLLTEAITLYRADFMLGFTLRDSPDFDEWQLSQEENLRRDLASALARLTRCHISQEEFEPAIAYAQRWLKIDPLSELAHRQLMQLYVWNDQRAAALRQYQECVRILKQELDTPPLEETTDLYERILGGEKPQESEGLGKQFFTPLRSTTPLHNFPTQPTPFVGRQKELARIVKHLQSPNCRLLTLTGPGGVGKTRLAIQAAIKLGKTFSNGIYFVPLAPVSSPDFLVSSIAESLNFSLNGHADPSHQLLNYLRNKTMLLVMDNFEHLTKEVGLLLKILNQAPHVKILITSRERLNLQEEYIFDVKGMSYPTDSNISQIEGYGAIALFLQKAYRVHSDFTLSDVEKPHIIRICQLVDGLPLGIELAAAWVRVLSCQEIAKEIENLYNTQHNLDFLATSLQDIPERHQSLRAVFEHSWQLLSTAEKTLFKKLSVFSGGASRAALERVAGATLPLMSALMDKSLLTRSASGRYTMHELLRQYAAEKLWQVPEEAKAVQARHCEYYVMFLQQREKKLKGEKQKEILAEIAKEIENIRVAWHWAISQGKIAAVEQALESLWYFYAMYGWFQEGVEAFEKAMTTLQKVEGKEGRGLQNHSLIGRMLATQGWFFLRQGLYKQADDVLQRSIDIFQRLGDRENMAVPLHYLGVLAGEVGQPEEARGLIQQSLTIYRETNNSWGIAWTLSNLGYHTNEPDKAQYVEAKQLLEESLEIYKSLGNKQGIAIALNNLGFITYRQGDYTAAKVLFEESLALRREIGYPRGIAVALNNLGHVAAALDDFQASEAYYHKALKIATEIQTIPLALAALGGLAASFAHKGNMERALELVTIALHHPASNKETQDRAKAFLAKVQPKLPPQTTPSRQPQIQDYPTQLESLVAEILATQNSNSQ